jgi:hypothetical protein
MMLVTVALLMTAMLVASAGAAQALGPQIRLPFGSGEGKPVEPATTCETTAGVAAFEWRSGGQACWITFPAQDAFSNVEPLL